MKTIKYMLAGIVLLLASLFCMGICMQRTDGSGPELLALLLFLGGLSLSAFGFFSKE